MAGTTVSGTGGTELSKSQALRPQGPKLVGGQTSQPASTEQGDENWDREGRAQWLTRKETSSASGEEAAKPKNRDGEGRGEAKDVAPVCIRPYGKK